MASKRPSFIYENAPLIEVIAEIRWGLQSLASIPGAAIDPFYDAMSARFTTEIWNLGFGHIERLAPPDAPIELLAGNPILRFRKRPNEWPLFQIGPGVMTCNTVPPYAGWREFRSLIGVGLETLEKSHPFGGASIKVTSKALRYIDGFTSKHGYQIFGDFVEQHLGITVGLPDGFVERTAMRGTLPQAIVDLRIECQSPAPSTLSLRFQPGTKENLAAVIGELQVATPFLPEEAFSRVEIVDWMDKAHDTILDAFEALASDELKNKMGPKRLLSVD